MKLSEFIAEKVIELDSQYKEVKFFSATNVTLDTNSVGENFLSTKTEAHQNVEEVDLSEIKEAVDGTKVTFEIKLPRKRKFTTKSYYLKLI